jgi:long-chain acyl-CoA synthetase
MAIRTLADLIRRQARDRADSPAVTFRESTWTYRDLDLRSSRLAQALAALGVRAQDRVAFLARNTPEFYALFFAAAKINAVSLAVNWRLSPREVRQILDDAEATVLIAGRELLDRLGPDRESKRVERVIVLEGGIDGMEDFGDLLRRSPAEDPGIEPAPTDVACMIYTSGTTGLPKGVMLTHRSLLAEVDGAIPVARYSPDAVNIVIMPLFHISGSGWSTLAFRSGAHNILLDEAKPTEIMRAIERHRVTHAFFVVTLLQSMLEAVQAGTADLSSLRVIAYGASAISDHVLLPSLAAFRCGFMQGYGLTESSGAVVFLDISDHEQVNERPELLRSAGRPGEGVEMRIADPSSGAELAEGETGEVWLRGAITMKGYWNQPAESAAVLTPDGWLRTGDAGCVRGGYLYIQDRVKDMIISGGENVYPAEVEKVIAGHPAVAEVAVIGVPHQRWGETVKAIVVRRPSAAVTDAELIAYCRENLAHYKCPSSIDWSDALPRNSTGKVLKTDLREPFWKGHARRVH